SSSWPVAFPTCPAYSPATTAAGTETVRRPRKTAHHLRCISHGTNHRTLASVMQVTYARHWFMWNSLIRARSAIGRNTHPCPFEISQEDQGQFPSEMRSQAKGSILVRCICSYSKPRGLRCKNSKST